MKVRPIEQREAADWERMRKALWPSAEADHARDIVRFFEGERDNPSEVLVALADEGQPVGFAELSIRPYAEGCETRRVAYLEGWFVESAHRRRGVGRALVAAAEAWGRAQGCTEFASDTELHNEVSATAHAALGFEEVERIICFRKEL
ncbi:MAG TPA: aminoglycoside 6'-N-acetyltransferase [Pyrinomonadaceae bacterium]|nr:aminoglycoside 6'-N-acetyltransferase [Pyrinomonadaceae bacterium]